LLKNILIKNKGIGEPNLGCDSYLMYNYIPSIVSKFTEHTSNGLSVTNMQAAEQSRTALTGGTFWPKRDSLYNETQVKAWLQDRTIPKNFQLGAAIGEGDCFFDAVAQGLNQISGKEEYDVKSLRLFCDEYAKKLNNHWVKGAINRDEGDKDNQKGTYEQYLTRVQFTAQEMEQNEKEGLKLGPAVWGRPQIEGRMFCEQYHVQLHVGIVFIFS
jgi:hypothetical protein